MRTIGAKDKKPRKKRKLYAGKLIKKRRKKYGKLVLYKSKRKKGDPIKIWFQEKKPMSYDGYKRWSPKMRLKISKTIKVFIGKPVLVDPIEISNKERLAETAIDILGYAGSFNLLMPTHSKNSYRVSFKKKADIKIIETEDGFYANVMNTGNLSRYWFWRDS